MCNCFFNIAVSLHTFLDQDAWILIFNVLQKISCLVYKAEYDFSGITPNTFSFNIISKRIAVNMQKSSPKSQQIPHEESKLVAGTGGEEENIIEKKAKIINEHPSGKKVRFEFPPKENNIKEILPGKEKVSAACQMQSLISGSNQTKKKQRNSQTLPEEIENFETQFDILFSHTSQFPVLLILIQNRIKHYTNS